MRAFVIVLLLGGVARANSPSPQAVCEGRVQGADCSSLYFPGGRCLPSSAGLSCQGNVWRSQSLHIALVGLVGIVALFVWRRRGRKA